MKKIYFLAIFFISCFLFGQKNFNPKNNFYFYENKGQIVDQNGKQNPNVKYLFNSSGINVQIKKSGFSYDVYEIEKKKRVKKEEKNALPNLQNNKEEFNYEYKFHRVDINFVNANKNPEIIAEGKSEDYDNYYNIPEKPEGITNVHRYQKITYKNLYPNIDLEFFKPNDTTKSIEYNYIINPGGKISDIKMTFNGAKTELRDGKLSMNLRFGEMQENIPNSWIENQASKQNIQVSFKDLGNSTFGFASNIETSDKKIVIDPVPTRIWSTYYYGDCYNYQYKKIRADNQNNVFTTTNIYYKSNIATSGAFQTSGNILDEYSCITKFNPDGTRNWATLIGNPITIYTSGGTSTIIYDFQINSSGDIYVVGNAADDLKTVPNNITTLGAHKEFVTQNTREGMIMKFNNSGQRIWGTYFGDDGFDDIYSISLDNNEDLFIGGKANSKTGICTANGYITTLGSWNNGFFAKFTKDGKQIYGSYLTGPVYHTAVDVDNNYIISSWVVNFWNSNEGTPGTHQPNMIGQYNSLIIKFDVNFKKLWGTYYGGKLLYSGSGVYDKNNFLFGIGTDNKKNIYIAGNTTANSDIATSGTHKSTFGGTDSDVFIAKLDENGKRVWGTYYGANTGFEDIGLDLSVKENGNLYISGSSKNTTDIATSNAYWPSNIYYDGYFSKFDSTGNLVWGSYYTTSYSIYFKNNFVYLFGGRRENMATILTFLGPLDSGAYLVSKFQDCQNNVSIISNSPICPNSDIKLQASGGTSYSWTGPNGFTSTLQNPVIPKATSANSGTYTCQISGTGDCDGTYTVDVKVEDKTAPVPNIATLPDLSGDCHFKITIIPTATDICAGNIIATTSNPLQYSIPGTYTITWKYDDGNGNFSTQTQKVTITSPALPTANTAQVFCKTQNPKISDIQISGQNIKWYDGNGNILSQNQILTDGSYFATQTINGCESDKISIKVTINSTALPIGNTYQEFCTTQNAKISDLKVTGTNLKFYDVSGNILAASTLLQDKTSYFVTQNLSNCESDKLEIKVGINPNAIPANDYSEAFCNDTTDNFKKINLTSYETKLISGTYNFDYFDQNNVAVPDKTSANLKIGQNIFNVKISTSDGCWKMVKLVLQLNEKPKINMPSNDEYCYGKSVVLDAGSGFSSYTWSLNNTELTQFKNQQKINVLQSGTYTVKVSNSSNCENSWNIEVKQSQIAEILKVEIVNNNVTVILSAGGDFVYSLDNIHWQKSNQFYNLSNGNHTVYVKTSNGCIIGEMNFTIFNIPNTITPNGDGKNDTWKIDGMENYPNSDVKIYDRYGNLVFSKITDGTFEWDGKNSGRIIETGTYWYIVKISDGRLFQGWVLLKNR